MINLFYVRSRAERCRHNPDKETRVSKNWPLVLGRFSRKKGHSKTIRRDGRCPRPADLLCIRNTICRGPVILYGPFMTRTK